MATKTKKRPAPPVEPEQNEEELALSERVEEDDDVELYKVSPEKPRIKVLLFSEPGAGKTTLAASAQDHEDMAPVVFANIEGGLLSVSHRTDIHAVDIKNTQQLYSFYRKIANKTPPFDEIGTVIIDNMTEFQTLNLDEVVRNAMESGKAKDRNRESYDEIWQEDYGISTVQLLRLIRWFKQLDLNLIITAHAKFVYPPSGNSRKAPELQQVEPVAVLPMLSQKLCKGIMGMVDFVWFMYYDAETNKRFMLTRPDGIIQAKTRGMKFAALLGPQVENPTMGDLYNKLVKAQRSK